ncbi:MAG: DNA-protecting protein DprA [Legionellales bacterium]|nr:DNA-protecting protein DprA [Legionellales bacterium]
MDSLNYSKIANIIKLSCTPKLCLQQKVALIDAKQVSYFLQNFTEYNIHETSKTYLRKQNTDLIKKSLTWLELSTINNIVCYDDNHYPPALRQIACPPLILFCQGNLELLKTNSIAIVGSRKSSCNGNKTALSFAKSLSSLGITIVSGLAKGIDSYAAIAALESYGSTIAVLGTGPDIIYPRENKSLYEKIRKQGLIVTEFFPKTEPRPHHFPRRNRIISALTLGTCIIEANIKSGSLITARFALEQNKEVFAIPGPITQANSSGTHMLIQQGAKLTTHPNDILCEIRLTQQKNNTDNFIQAVLILKKRIMDVIAGKNLTVDQIQAATEADKTKLITALLQLEQYNLIKYNSGGYELQLEFKNIQ